MVKQWIGIAVIAVLGIILVVNIIQDNKKDDLAQDVLDPNAEFFAPPEDSGLNVGDKAPNFALNTLDGERVQLSDLEGKKVMLNFWATWCPPCREEMPEMQEFHEKYGDEVVILAVNNTSSETDVANVGDFISEFDYTFTVLMDDQNVTDEYMAISIPTTYFIGTDGVIQQPRRVGPMSFDFMEEMMSNLN